MENAAQSGDDSRFWFTLANATGLLTKRPEEAHERAADILKLIPAQPHTLSLLVSARRVQGDATAARNMLEAMAAEQPKLAAIHLELGRLLADLGERESAIQSLRRVVELEPEHPSAWRMLGDELAEIGAREEAAKAYTTHFRSLLLEISMLEEMANSNLKSIETSQEMLQRYLSIYRTDVTAISMLGHVCLKTDQFEDAERLFNRALELAPNFTTARRNLAIALHYQLRWLDERQQLDLLLADDPENPEFRRLKALALSNEGHPAESLQYSEEILRSDAGNPLFWMVNAYALRALGRQEECIVAFRRAIELQPDLGEAWWGLANLKIFGFTTSEIQAMRSHLAREDLSDESRTFMDFALGKALEDSRDYQESFESYSHGNALIKARRFYDVDEITVNVRRVNAQFTSDYFRGVTGHGSPTSEPIFIVGLPRSGSTLVEQILSSHSSVEGTGELPVLNAVIRRLPAADDLGALVAADNEGLRRLGDAYLDGVRRNRKLERPHFVDKMLNNFHHTGIICAALPHAKIIDIRRHPLACGFSIFKHLFPSGTGPFYSLGDIGRYYKDYVDLMAHIDSVLPGRVHRIFYEDLVCDFDVVIRRLLDYCELPFEEAPLKFHESMRGVLTSSSEQVRRPVYTDALDHWRHYEEWLAPLAVELGAVLECYPAVPAGN